MSEQARIMISLNLAVAFSCWSAVLLLEFVQSSAVSFADAEITMFIAPICFLVGCLIHLRFIRS